jgi:hypothetical protein
VSTTEDRIVPVSAHSPASTRADVGELVEPGEQPPPVELDVRFRDRGGDELGSSRRDAPGTGRKPAEVCDVDDVIEKGPVPVQRLCGPSLSRM